MADTRVDVAIVAATSVSLPVYANEAAAIIGGIATGKFYQTLTGEIRIKL